jgi:hypothetical protein
MDLQNDTRLAAHMFRGVIDEETMLAVVVCRLSCLIGSDGSLERQDLQDPVRLAPRETPEGALEDDSAPVKPQVDVVVLGQAVSARPVRAMTVALQVGDRERELRVTGDRAWQAARGLNLERAIERSRRGEHDPEALVPSAPAPFRELPVTWARAFGGAARLDGGELPWPDNPDGLGYQELLEHAVGGPLPNLEEPGRGQVVTSWRDRIDAVCLAPMPMRYRARVERGIKIDEAALSFEVLPQHFLVAPAGQSFEELRPGTPIAVHGMHPDGAVAFRVPELPAELAVALGEDHVVLPCRLDTVEVWPNDRRVSFALRASFRYLYRPGESRSATLRAARCS